MPTKRKGKKIIVVVKDDNDKGENDEEKPLAISHEGMRTSVEELWRREKTEEEKKLLGMLNMGIHSSQDFDIRLPRIVDEGFYHNFTIQDVRDVSDDKNKWLQYFLTLKVDKRRIVYEVEDQTINRYDMLHLIRGGRLNDEVVEELVAKLHKWLKLPENVDRKRKLAIVTSYLSTYSFTDHKAWARDVLTIQLCLDRMVSGYDQTSTFRAFEYESVPCQTQKDSYNCDIHAYFFIKAILKAREAMNIEALQIESKMLWARLAAQIICKGCEWKKLRLKLDIDDPEYILYFRGNDVPLIE
ncbi:uncharacterized protein A4U43_C07F17340 [Asparagus officinalis]|uniref:Uncharacterized protein n=1 Tax=Asparagus officinalis TaxID=4686 RepID=A0A5P1ECP0_ASPOF|nr:uncharacterized protein A4U43_C07F17340 [Asparagus officinalis]